MPAYPQLADDILLSSYFVDIICSNSNDDNNTNKDNILVSGGFRGGKGGAVAPPFGRWSALFSPAAG